MILVLQYGRFKMEGFIIIIIIITVVVVSSSSTSFGQII
jgi:hypothetical protein